MARPAIGDLSKCAAVITTVFTQRSPLGGNTRFTCRTTFGQEDGWCNKQETKHGSLHMVQAAGNDKLWDEYSGKVSVALEQEAVE